MTKKITKATFKSFIRKNQGNLYVKVQSSFNGMIDGVEHADNPQFKPQRETDLSESNTLGIDGVWLVNGGRDYFSAYDDESFTGISVYNACGSFTVAIKK
jgi:hypothetical protein